MEFNGKTVTMFGRVGELPETCNVTIKANEASVSEIGCVCTVIRDGNITTEEWWFANGDMVVIENVVRYSALTLFAEGGYALTYMLGNMEKVSSDKSVVCVKVGTPESNNCAILAKTS